MMVCNQGMGSYKVETTNNLKTFGRLIASQMIYTDEDD